MPVYEYKCRKCGHSFDHLARTLSEPPPKCPKCAARNPVKQLSTFNASVSAGGSGASCSTGTCPTGTCSL